MSPDIAVQRIGPIALPWAEVESRPKVESGLLTRIAQLGALHRDGHATTGDTHELFALAEALAGPPPKDEAARRAQRGPERVRPEPARVPQSQMKSNRGRFRS